MKRTALLFIIGVVIPFCLPGCGSSNYSAAETAYRNGEYRKAIELFTKAAENSDNPAIYGNRGNCYSSLGNLDAALKDYETAIKKALEISKDENDPKLAYLYYNRGYAYERAAKFKEAVKDYEKTISLDGTYPDVKNNLAWILATCPGRGIRNPRRAVEIATAECKRTEFKDGSFLDTLAAAHASASDFSKAVERQTQAIELTLDPTRRQSFGKRLELYRNRKPFIDSANNN